MPSIALAMCFVILCIYKFFFIFWCDSIILVFIGIFFSYILLAMQMSSLPLAYIRYTDGATRHTWHIASTSSVFYTPDSELFCSRGVFLCTTTNTSAEYMSIVSLLMVESSMDISNLVVRLDSQLVVM